MKPNRGIAGTTRLANSGTVISVRGSVVDIRFDEQLPPIYSVLRAGAEKQIVIEVLPPTLTVTPIPLSTRSITRVGRKGAPSVKKGSL